MSDAAVPDPMTRDVRDQLIAPEHAALVRWCQGDPSGYLAISAEDVVSTPRSRPSGSADWSR
ncbi:hypothetical protein [Xanthomonas sp. XNM01]|uniref:hypothetical protein n=1 Tax=Xanthomonas sp. XNM01 TaxID=2769289 RepID=UPI00178413F2|nr:hypothetical protein [Xanthomonas sp. XNM01]MBD9370504.1 hypothetical protein [Xanthomonas sp. XNM01]